MFQKRSFFAENMKFNLERGETPRAIYEIDFSRTRTFDPVQNPDVPESLIIVNPDGNVTCFEHRVIFQGEKDTSGRSRA